MSRRFKFWTVFTLGIITVAMVTLPLFSSVAAKGPNTNNLNNAKQLATACVLYADDHDGRFPLHLSELEPDYLPPGGMAQMQCTSLDSREKIIYSEANPGASTRKPLMLDWLYFGAGFEKQNPPSLLIAAPQKTTFVREGIPQRREHRVCIRGDTSGYVILEDEYQKLLTETIRELSERASARRSDASRPVPESVAR